MITKITDENRQSYDEKFERLNNKLSSVDAEISKKYFKLTQDTEVKENKTYYITDGSVDKDGDIIYTAVKNLTAFDENTEYFEPIIPFGFQLPHEISSLFANLNIIANATHPKTHAYLIPPEYYAMLPADEPFFEINANTRVINVPDVFKKNGLSIQNDHLAEVVYFKIDRYFDRNDLATDTNIYIDWKIGKKEGRSVALWPTTVIDNEHIYFGWGISNDMTAEKGTIQFAVRIESATDNDGILGPDLVFNTLVASIGINAGLNISNDVEQIQVENSIRARFLNSSYTPESFDPLPELQFAQDGNLPEIKYFTLIPGTGEDSTLPLLVTLTGAVEDGRTYTYSWYEQGGTITSHSSAEVNDNYDITSSNNNTDRYYWVRVQGRRIINGAGGEQFYQTTPFLRSNVCCIPAAVAPNVTINILSIEGAQWDDNIQNFKYEGESLIENGYIFVPADIQNGDLKSVGINIRSTFDNAIQPGRICFASILHDENTNLDNSNISFDDKMMRKTDYSWGNEEENITDFSKDIVINQLNDNDICQARMENVRNHTKAYSEYSNSLKFKVLPEASLFTNALQVSIMDNNQNELIPEENTNRIVKTAEMNEIIFTASLSIPSIFKKPSDCHISYSWRQIVNEQPEIIDGNILTITGSTGMNCQLLVHFEYCGKEIDIEGPSYHISID